MKEIATSKGKFTFCESTKELIIDRYCEFQKYMLQDSGIGSDIEAVYRHFEKIDAFLAVGKVQEAINERANQHFNFYMMLNSVNIEHISFACLVHSINGEQLTDYSESALIEICKRLGKEVGVTHEQLKTLLEDVKKKLLPN